MSNKFSKNARLVRVREWRGEERFEGHMQLGRQDGFYTASTRACRDLICTKATAKNWETSSTFFSGRLIVFRIYRAIPRR
jgi:hypothetical protein